MRKKKRLQPIKIWYILRYRSWNPSKSDFYFFCLTQDFVLDMPDFDGLQPFLFAHTTAIRPFLFLVTARENCRLRMFYVFWESRVYAVAVETI